MYTYVISRAVQRGYLSGGAAFKQTASDAAMMGYKGVLQKVSKDSSGKTNVTDICVGTNVGNAAYYYARTRATNDLHGLGAFLIMNEQLQFPVA
jgi:unsaturated rhamnogalacturonyl hydrolase